MSLEKLEEKLMGEYRSALRTYGVMESRELNSKNSERKHELNKLWERVEELKRKLVKIREERLNNKLPFVEFE